MDAHEVYLVYYGVEQYHVQYDNALSRERFVHDHDDHLSVTA